MLLAHGKEKLLLHREHSTNHSVPMISSKYYFSSFMLSGLLIYFHWEAMLISYLATRTVIYPFSNLQEMYESDFQFYTLPNSAMWDSFKHGDDLWKKIYKGPYLDDVYMGRGYQNADVVRVFA